MEHTTIVMSLQRLDFLKMGGKRGFSDMKKRLIARYLILPLSCVLLLLSSCFRGEFEYLGDYPDLFSVALGSILGTRGYEPSGIARVGARIEILEEDNNGRILFRYSEDSIGDITGVSRLIVQRSDDEYAYFYPHYNFITNSGGRVADEDMDLFKETNSWNQEMSDDSEFERVRIVRRKEAGPISDRQLLSVYHDIYPDTQINRRNNMRYWMIFLRTDDYGRSVYLGLGVGREWMYTDIAVIFQPDHSFDLETGTLVITNHNNYQTELRLFMEANGWNTPP